MSESILAPQVTVTYTITTIVEDAHLDFFSLSGLGSRFYTPNNFLAGDRVKVTIQRIPHDTPRDPVPEDQH